MVERHILGNQAPLNIVFDCRISSVTSCSEKQSMFCIFPVANRKCDLTHFKHSVCQGKLISRFVLSPASPHKAEPLLPPLRCIDLALQWNHAGGCDAKAPHALIDTITITAVETNDMRALVMLEEVCDSWCRPPGIFTCQDLKVGVLKHHASIKET